MTDIDETQSKMECPRQAPEVWEVYWGRSDAMQIVEEKVKELEKPDKREKFPVHLAAFEGRLQDIAKLVEEDPITPDYCQLTPLHCAALGGQSNVVQYLIDKSLCNVDIQDGGHHAPLHLSAWGGCRDTTKVLLSHHANVSLGNQDAHTALHVAAFKGNNEIVEDLIGCHADVNRTDSLKRTPIHLAAMEGHTRVVQTLIDKAAMLDIGDARGRTPLHLAAGAGHVNTVKLLVANGASKDFMSGDAWTPILFAAHEGKLNVIELLLGEGADVNIPNKDTRGYLLHGFSCRVNKLKDSEHELFVELFNRIVDATEPCNVTAARTTGSTVLDIILCCNNPSLLHKLLKGLHKLLLKGPLQQYLDGFPLDKPLYILSPEHIPDDFSLHTSASFLVWKLPLTDLEKLSEKHMKEVINARNFLGQTVLHLLVMEQCNIERQGCKDMGRDYMKKECFCKMQFLIEKGLDMSDVDINGRTPFQLGWLSDRNFDTMSRACPKCDKCVVHRVVKVIQDHIKAYLNEDGVNLGLLAIAIEKLHQDANELVQSLYSMEPYGQVNTSTEGKNKKIFKAVNTLVHNIMNSVEAQDGTFQCEPKISGSMAEGTKTGRMDEVDYVLLQKNIKQAMHMTKTTVAESTLAIMTPHNLDEFTFTDSEHNQCFRGLSYIAKLNQLIMQAITNEQLQLDDSVLSIDNYARRLGFVSTLYITWYDKNDDTKLHGHKVAVDLLPAVAFDPWIIVMETRYFDNHTIGGEAIRNGKDLSSVLEDRKLLCSFDKDSIRGYHIAKMVLNLFQDVTFTIANRNRKAQDVIQSYLLKSCLFWLVDKKDKFKQYYPALSRPKFHDGSHYVMRSCIGSDSADQPPMRSYIVADSANQPRIRSYIEADSADQPPMPSYRADGGAYNISVGYNPPQVKRSRTHNQTSKPIFPQGRGGSSFCNREVTHVSREGNMHVHEAQKHPGILESSDTPALPISNVGVMEPVAYNKHTINQLSKEHASNARIWAVQIFQMLHCFLEEGYNVRNYFLPDQIVEVRDKALTQELCKTCLVIFGQ